MKTSKKTLIVVSSEFEAKQAVAIARDKRNIKIIALSLDAEFYLEKRLRFWQNPLYGLLDKKSSISVYKYLSPNFKISYDFAGDGYYQYIRDRFAYYLTEMDRSLDFAKKVIGKLKPDLIICGELEDYKGASVINGSLKKNAFYLVAKSRKIPFKKLRAGPAQFSLKQVLGKIFLKLRVSIKQKITGDCDLLIVATARHVVQIENLIKEITKSGISVKVLTYNVTLFYKKRLDKLTPDYLEKNRLINDSMKKEAQTIRESLIRDKLWRKFFHPKYKKNKIITAYLRKKLGRIVREEFDEIVVDIPLAKSVLDKLKPKLLLTTTDPDTKVFSFIKYAKTIGTRSISIQHGIYFNIDPPSNSPVSDLFITWSKLSKKMLATNPYFKSVKVIVGQFPFPKKYTARIVKTYSEHKSVLILTAIDMVDINLKMYWYKRLFFNLEKAGLGHRFIIRANPFQRQDDLRALINNTKLDVRLDGNYNLLDSIKAADIVIYENTDAGMEAMLFEKPTIYFNPYSGQDFFGVGEFNASMTVFGDSELDSNLAKFLSEDSEWLVFAKRGKIFARKYFGLEEEKSNRIVKIIESMIKN